MRTRVKFSVLGFMLLPLVAALPSFAADYQAQTLETAHGLFHAATNAAMYAEAAQQYEYLVEEEDIRNGALFYTLGNSWFMAGDLGRAILNYRRAERFMPTNEDLRHNLDAALEQRADLIPAQEPHPMAARLLGWHFNTSTGLRWWLFATSWIALWGAGLWLGRTAQKEARITVAVAGMVAVALMASLATERMLEWRAAPGVVVAPEVLARKGDGEIYGPAFLDPLHAGTGFARLENRDTWWHIRLADGQRCWIPSRTAAMVSD